MGRKCSTVWDGEKCISGYVTNKSKTQDISFPRDNEMKSKWCRSLPNVLNPKEVTIHMSICLKHCPDGFAFKY